MNASLTVGNQLITLEHVTGEVLSYHKHSESHVYGGGGGHSNSRVSIKTQEVTHTEFFLLDQQGIEHEVRLVGEKHVALRQGQKVTLVKAVLPDGRYYWVYLWVQNTDMECFLRERYQSYANKKLWHYPLACLAILFFKYFFDMTGWLLPAIFGVLTSLIIIAIVTSKILRPLAIKKLDKQIRKYTDHFF